MAVGLSYKFGKALGLILVIAYLLSAVLIVAGSIEAAKALLGRSDWIIILGTIITCIAALWFIPRGIDVLLLTPLAVYGITIGWGWTWMMAALLVGVPVLIVVFLSIGRK